MFNLVLKDILIQKKNLILSCLVGLVFALINAKVNSNSSTIIFIMIPIFISYSLLMGACGYDDKNKCDIMLNSLPISRVNLVISKYLSTFVFILIGLFVSFLITTILRFSSFYHLNRLMKIEDIMGAVISIILLSSFYFPIYFKFGYHKSRYINMILFFSAFFIPPILVGTILKGGNPPYFIVYLNSQPNWLVAAFILIIAFLVVLISMFISSKIYLNKDL